MNQEEWRAVVGYEGLYEVSSAGEVRTLINRSGKIRQPVQRLLTPSVNSVGYRTVSLSKNKVSRKYQISRLVATAFHPNPDNRRQVNHISGIKTDDRVGNLEWSTPLENLEHAKRIGLNTNYGESHCFAVLTAEQVSQIRSEYRPRKVSGIALARRFGVSDRCVYNILEGKSWRSVK